MQFTREEQIRRRLNWFIEARELGSVSRACKNCGISRKTVSRACKNCGISRKTYYKWWNIYQNSDADKDSLADRSRRPQISLRNRSAR
ncbi:MAG: LysR family transcriptional regulator [Deltaproteobacteria bacterium]|nr:LysR family transcriptional regulator [Deltaproteobacteria bacterium]